MGIGRRVACIRSLGNAKGLQLECARVFHKILLVPLLMYDSETVILKERSSLGLY